MLSPKQVLDAYFLDTRCMVLEIAATLDRFDAASNGEESAADDSDSRLPKLYESLAILAERKPSTDRAETLLRLFSDPVD